MTHTFCETCNRVRVSATGVLYTCLGQEDRTDLKPALRGSEADEHLHAAIDAGISGKPKGHDFLIGCGGMPALARHMSVLGG
ncbi:molybdenum cofactor biosynthesis protein A [Aurantimonas sp. 22II-16-19i]|nr:molybdenum cofactor biosynthesis protein A [Aurantimonas sp. 22II-16-19i]